ncbi:MAG: hypothetical protein V3S14_03190 [Anaerolineae bacterium]
MDPKNRDQREKFPEPRGWAMNWVFAQEMDAQLAEQEQVSSTGSRKKFAEPRGWAVKWDGTALSEARERRNEQD